MTIKYTVFGRPECEVDHKLLAISIHYNSASSNKFNIMLESIEAVLKSDWDCLEFALVDNGSSDDTWEKLNEFVGSRDLRGKRVHLIGLPKNLGFARANNIAYFALSDKLKDLKYIAVVNNDLVVTRDAFRKLTRFLEIDKRIAGVQGIIKRYFEEEVDYGPGHVVYSKSPFRVMGAASPQLRELLFYPHFPSYLQGAFSVFRNEAIREVGFFPPYAFMFGDDVPLGASLWKRGYLLLYVPLPVAKHASSSTVSTKRDVFLWWDEYTLCCASLQESNGLFKLLNIISIPIISSFEYLKGTISGDLVLRAKALAKMASLAECPPFGIEGTEWPRLVARGSLYPFNLLLLSPLASIFKSLDEALTRRASRALKEKLKALFGRAPS